MRYKIVEISYELEEGATMTKRYLKTPAGFVPILVMEQFEKPPTKFQEKEIGEMDYKKVDKIENKYRFMREKKVSFRRLYK